MRILLFLARLGSVPGDTPETTIQKRFMIFLGLAMSMGGLLWGTLSLVFGLFLQSIIPYGYALATAVNFTYFAVSKQFNRVRFVQVLISLLLPFAFQVVMGGFVRSGGVMLWALISLVGAFTYERLKNSLYWIFVYVTLTVVMGFVDPYAIPAMNPGPVLQTVIFVINFSIISAIVAGLSYYFLSSRSTVMRELSQAKAETDTIMQAANQGLCLLDEQLKTGLQHSEMLTQILGVKTKRRDFVDLLAETSASFEQEGLRDYLRLFFTTKLNARKMKMLNPVSSISFTDQERRNHHLLIDFTPVLDKDRITRFVLASITDVTAQKEMEVQVADAQKQAEAQSRLLSQMLGASPAMIREFLAEAERELDQLESTMRKEEDSKDYSGIGRIMMRCIHTIKGNAALVGLESVAMRCHAIEDSLKTSVMSEITGSDLLGHLMQIQSIRSEIQFMQTLLERVHVFAGLNGENPLEMMDSFVRKTAAETGKKIELRTEVEPAVRSYLRNGGLRDIIVQLVRNAILHGIEAPEVRLQENKAEAGLLEIKGRREEDHLLLELADDGRGLDMDRIVEKAVATGRLKAEEARTLPASRVAALIFEPSFSTASQVSEHAGRGFGMDIVKSRVEDLGGRIRVASAARRYMKIAIRVPLASLSGEQGALDALSEQRPRHTMP